MFHPSIKISSNFYPKMVTSRFLKKSFWTKKSKSKVDPENFMPSCGESPSKCLDPTYGKPLPKKKKSFLNFCKGEQPIKPFPSNCKEPECEKRETFWEYLFGRRKKPEKVSPRFLKKYVKCSEYSAPKVQKLLDPQPKSPAEFSPPRAVITREFIESAEEVPSNCSAALFFEEKCCKDHSAECKPFKPFKMTYDELRPSKNVKSGFFCGHGVTYEDIFKPARENAGDPVIRVGRASKLSGELPKPPSSGFKAENLCEVGQTKVKTSRIERLKILTVSSSDNCPVPNFKAFKSSKS